VKHVLLCVSLLGAAGWLSAGCQNEDQGSAGEANSEVTAGAGLPCAVDDVMKRRCRSCHNAPPLFGAPMALNSWEDMTAVSHGRKIYELVGERIHAATRPMPPSPAPRLSAGELAVVDDWIAAGAPRSTQSCTPGVDAGTDAGSLGCQPDQHIVPSRPYAMPVDQDDAYVCFGLDIAPSEKRHIIAFSPKIDNARIVHHVVVFESPTPVPAEPQPCSSEGLFRGRMVYGWAPGGQNLVLPPEAGFPIEGTKHYVVQMHYNNVNHLVGQTDSSGIDMCTTSQLRANDADVMAFGTANITIPARSTLDVTCGVTLPPQTPQIHIFAAMPHMHQLGKALVNTLRPAGGLPAIDLGTQSSWDFNSQAWLPINASAGAGGRVETRCAWTNTTDSVVKFGENTADEMCYAFTMYYPRVPNMHWAAPAYTSTCRNTR
jgi:hypothetical protein